MKNNEEIVPLNNKLFNEFAIEELEERYETDPFVLTSLFNLGHGIDADNSIMGCSCKSLSDCPHLTCVCDGPGTDDGGGCGFCSPICELGISR